MELGWNVCLANAIPDAPPCLTLKVSQLYQSPPPCRHSCVPDVAVGLGDAEEAGVTIRPLTPMSLCGCIWWPLNPLTEEKTEPRPTSLVPTSAQLPSHQAFLPQHASRTDFRPKLPPQGQRLAASFLLSLNRETCLRSCRSVCLSCVSRALPGTQHGHSICTDWVSQRQEGGTCEHSTPIWQVVSGTGTVPAVFPELFHPHRPQPAVCDGLCGPMQDLEDLKG